MFIADAIDNEIQSSRQDQKVINLVLVKDEEGVFKAYTSLKLEGEYMLTTKGVDKKIVQIEQVSNQISVFGLDIDEAEINVFLTKNTTSLLSTVKERLKRDDLQSEPFFIVGPPGTGKTKVITKIIEEAIKTDKRVLVVSPTNMAVENVFERMNLDSFKDGEVLLTIKTDNEALIPLNPVLINKRRKESIKDEISLLKEIQEELLAKRREIEPLLYSAQKDEESISTLLANLKKEIELKSVELKKLGFEAKGYSSKIDALTSNILIRSLSEILLSKKVDKLKEKKSEVNDKMVKLIKEINSLEKKRKTDKHNLKKDKLCLLNKEHKEVLINLQKVKEEIAKLEKQVDLLSKNTLLSKAKIVGATLPSAATSKIIQREKFDMVIVDESSMALFPMLVSTSQVLNEAKKQKHVEYIPDKAFTKMQNKAVEESLKKQLVIIGDPRQLSPIAKTQKMKETVFDVYGIERIFDKEKVANTIFLDINFRNHPDIVNLISNFFYGGLLKSGKTATSNSKSLFIRRSLSKMTPSEGSYVNAGNVNIVIEQVKKALERGRRSIGVITPYRKQADFINEQLKPLRDEYIDSDIQAGTIHKFQGKEKEIIIYDITFSPSQNGALPKTYEGGKNSEVAKLLNVATTRAEDFFILIGDTDGISHLKDDSVFVQWVQKIQKLQ
jgi:hypothetical protein